MYHLRLLFSLAIALPTKDRADRSRIVPQAFPSTRPLFSLILVHSMNKRTILVNFPPNFGDFAVRPIFYAKKMCAATSIMLICAGSQPSHAQAPIRDRSESATPVVGARRAADVAGNALTAAESRAKVASERRKKAEAALIEANNELEAARKEAGAAASELARARQADAEARAALGRLLDARKSP